MPNKDSEKLSLCQVLVEEYEHLLPDNYPKNDTIFDFDESEFKLSLDIETLCTAIYIDNKEAIKKIPNKTDYEKPDAWLKELLKWLNELLNNRTFYTILKEKKPTVTFSKDIENLANEIKDINQKDSSTVSGITKIKKLNRLLLEEAYPNITPKYREKKLSLIYKHIHALEPNRSALCLSGGGIRSATFSLGVIQGLANHGLLGEFDYLSTVSGGGYIGGWLTAWIRRPQTGIGLEDVIKELKNHPKSALEPEPAPIKNLRSYSNYLTPKLGIMSADVWSLVAIYLRNLFLNWLVFIPLLLAALIIPRICVPIVSWTLSNNSWRIALIISGAIAIIIHIVYIESNLHSNKEYNPTLGKFLCLCLLPLVLSAILLTTSWAWYPGKVNLTILLYFVLIGVAIHFFGWLIYSTIFIKKEWKFSIIKQFRVGVATGALGGLFSWLIAPNLSDKITSYAGHYVCFAAPTFLGILLIIGFIFVGFIRLEDKNLEWMARFCAWVLIAITVWSGVSSLVIFGPVGLLILWGKAPTLIASVGGISGIITLFFSFSSKTSFGKKQNESNGLISTLMNNVLIISASIFIVFLIALLSLGTDPIVRFINNNKVSTKLLQTKIIDKSDFWAGEFESEATIEKLCNTINKDLYPISTENTTKSIEELNDLLTHTDFYGITKGKRRDINFSNEITELDYKTKKYRDKEYSYLSNNEKSNRKRLNRLVLEETYPQETPKSRNPYSHLGLILNTPLKALLVLFCILVIFVLCMSFLIDINKFSLHSLYRNRLIRAYLGASNPNRKPNLFTGFYEKDDIKMTIRPYSVPTLLGRMLQWWHKLRNLFKNRQPSETSPSQNNTENQKKNKLFHVVNITLNLVKGENLAWQQRKAASFTISPLHSGSSGMHFDPDTTDNQSNSSNSNKSIKGCYRRTEVYGGEDGGISLGTAITVSGAAASPNMGYHSSPVLSFLMTLFNVRLGLWLGNPSDDKKFGKQSPTCAVGPIISEAFGLTDEKTPYIYLSDGGHFENLGLYEMIVRRCHFIVLVDASCDNTEEGKDYKFEDLGNAIRKIRIDLGVEIEFDKAENYSINDLLKNGKHCVTFTIKYSKVDKNAEDGKLLYIKPTLCGNEPVDIVSYKKDNPKFPHESTGDQWFSESQFESYRKLGFHAIEEIVEGDKKDYTLCDFFKQAESYVTHQNIVFPTSPTEKTAKVVGATSINLEVSKIFYQTISKDSV